MFSFQIVYGCRGLEEIAKEWEQITNSMKRKRFFHLIDWYRCYLEALEDHPEQVFFCVIYCDNQAEAIIPFRKTSRRILGIKMKVLELPHHPHLSLGDFIAAGNDKFYNYIPCLLKELKRLTDFRWDYLYFSNVLEDSSAFHAFAQQPLGFHVIKQQMGHCNYLVVTPYEQLLQRLSPNFRNNLRKARNRSYRLGASYTSASTLPELENLYSQFLDVETSGWKGEQGISTAIKLDERLILFYRELLYRYASRGECEIHVIKDKEKPISAAFTLIINDTFYILKIAYNEAYAKLSPGHMLREHILRNCHVRDQINYLNFVTAESWHDQWQPLNYNIFKLYIYKSTLLYPYLISAFTLIDSALHNWRHRFFIRKRGKLKMQFSWKTKIKKFLYTLSHN
jgi:hypothetical protein